MKFDIINITNYLELFLFPIALRPRVSCGRKWVVPGTREQYRYVCRPAYRFSRFKKPLQRRRTVIMTVQQQSWPSFTFFLRFLLFPYLYRNLTPRDHLTWEFKVWRLCFSSMAGCRNVYRVRRRCGEKRMWTTFRSAFNSFHRILRLRWMEMDWRTIFTT